MYSEDGLSFDTLNSVIVDSSNSSSVQFTSDSYTGEYDEQGAASSRYLIEIFSNESTLESILDSAETIGSSILVSINYFCSHDDLSFGLILYDSLNAVYFPVILYYPSDALIEYYIQYNYITLNTYDKTYGATLVGYIDNSFTGEYDGYRVYYYIYGVTEVYILAYYDYTNEILYTVVLPVS